MGLYLPPIEKCTVGFMKDLLSKKKLVGLYILKMLTYIKALKQADVKMILILRYKELAVKNVWGYIKELPDLLEYFQEIEDEELPDHSFMWGVIGILRREAWQKMLKDARKARSLGIDEPKDNLVEIHPQILEELLAVPLQSKSNSYRFFNDFISKPRVELHICSKAEDRQDSLGRSKKCTKQILEHYEQQTEQDIRSVKIGNLLGRSQKMKKMTWMLTIEGKK